MSKEQYLKLKKTLEMLSQKAEEEALAGGIDITADEFQNILDSIKERILANKGITEEEYDIMQAKIEEAENNVGKDVGTLIDAQVLLLKVKKAQEKIDNEQEKIYNEIENINTNLKNYIEEQIQFIRSSQLEEDDVKRMIPKLPEIKSYDNDIRDLQDKLNGIVIPEVSKQIDNTEQIKKLDEKIHRDIEELKKQKGEMKKELRGFSETLLGKQKINNKKLQEAVIEPVRRLSMGIQADLDDLKVSPIDDETPSGIVNGTNKDFVIVYIPKSGTLKVYANGQRLTLTEDYTLNSKIITLTTAPPTGSIIRVDYKK